MRLPLMSRQQLPLPAFARYLTACGVAHTVALDVNGLNAKRVWGAQWVKMLELLYEGVTVGIHGTPGRLVGGSSPEGTAARVRVHSKIEWIMSEP